MAKTLVVCCDGSGNEFGSAKCGETLQDGVTCPECLTYVVDRPASR